MKNKKLVVLKASVLLVLAAFGIAVIAVHPKDAQAMRPVLKEFEDAFVKLHEEVRPCVVNIDTKSTMEMSDWNGNQFEDLFRFFGVPTPRNTPQEPRRHAPSRRGTGSGFIYDGDGRIITNNHVVEGAEEITVRLWDGSEHDADVVGTDPDTDLAVIKIDTDKKLPVARMGDSDALKVGQFAIAMGSPRGFEGSLSFGHVSALGRDELNLPGMRFQNFIQTDAAINLGNSGGPLCNIDGEVIGINVAILYGANSLGFAIPVNTAKEIVPQLISEGKVTRGYLGVEIRDAKPLAEGLGLSDELGALVGAVREDTPAAEAELKRYDVIRKVNGEEVKDASDLIRKISAYAPGEKVTLDIWRDEKSIKKKVTLAEYAGDGLIAESTNDKLELGLRVRTLTPEMVQQLGLEADTQGVLVADVEPGSPADDAGLTPSDVIIEVAKKDLSSSDEFFDLVKKYGKPGKDLLIGYIRGRTGRTLITAIESSQG